MSKQTYLYPFGVPKDADIHGIGAEIRRAREARGWSQAKLASMVGTTQQSVERLEKGLTRHSRYRVAIMQVLDLADAQGNLSTSFPSATPEQVQTGNDQIRSFPAKPTWADLEARRAAAAGWSPDGSNTKLPTPGDYLDIYGLSEPREGEEWGTFSQLPIDCKPKGFPIANSTSAFGVIINSTEMSPILDVGEIAIINPDLPPIANANCLFLHQKIKPAPGIFRRVLGIDKQSWQVSTGSNVGTETLTRSEWTCAGVVVAKVFQFR